MTESWVPSPSPGAPSPILSIERGEVVDPQLLAKHSHPEPILMWTMTATVTISAGSRDWLIPPGYGFFIPGGIEHTGTVLHAGDGSVVIFDADNCPIPWSEPTGVAIDPLLRELIVHLHRSGPDDPSRRNAEALLVDLLTPLPAHDMHLFVPSDPRVRVIAERLTAHPADQRELAAWADEVHAGVRTLSRLFRLETGLSFAQWRTQVRIRAAIQLLADGASVNATARAVGYRKPGAFIAAFRRSTGHTPGTYVQVDGHRRSAVS